MKIKNRVALVFMLVFMISLVGCSKKEEPTIEASVGFGELESTSEEETTKDPFAVDDPNIAGYEIRESTSASHTTEETREIEFNVPTETVNKDNLTDEELVEFEVMEETFTHPLTGEFFNRSDLANVYNMMYEAQTLWEPEFDAGRVSKEVVEKYFNYVYEAVDKEDRDKVIQEILSPNITVEFKEPESWPLEEAASEEDIQSEDKIDSEELDSITKGLKESGNETEKRWANLSSDDLRDDTVIIDDGQGWGVGDLTPYTPD